MYRSCRVNKPRLTYPKSSCIPLFISGHMYVILDPDRTARLLIPGKKVDTMWNNPGPALHIWGEPYPARQVLSFPYLLERPSYSRGGGTSPKQGLQAQIVCKVSAGVDNLHTRTRFVGLVRSGIRPAALQCRRQMRARTGGIGEL